MMESPARAMKQVIGASLILSLIAGIMIPMVTDEAYYIDWATRSSWPALGFFDHPPFVSWMASGVRLWRQIYAARILVWLSHLLSVFFIWKTARMIVPQRSLTAVALTVSSIGGIASGFLLTPDSGLALMWSIAIHEAVVAIRGNQKRWLTAGLATGVGLLSKYTMVLIGPVFLWAMIRDARRQLASPWPYLGGVVCALIISPHLWWQSQNDWITLRFQFGHGLSIKQSIGFSSELPEARDAEPDSPTAKLRSDLFAALRSVKGFDEAIRKPKPEKTRWEKAVQYTGDFFGGVAGLWGVYAIVALISVTRLILKKYRWPMYERLSGMGVVEAAAFFPLVFFGMLSPFSKIEANWPAMHMAPLAIWVTSRFVLSPRILVSALITHTIAIAGLIYVLVFPESVPFARNNRVLLESKGYRALGEWVRDNFANETIAVDSYQLKSAIRYYAPQTPVAQWPGITRGSEYTRGTEDDRTIERQLLTQRDVTVLSMNSTPQLLDGFTAESFAGIRVCPDGQIGLFSIQQPVLPCEKGLREWWITKYKLDSIVQNPR